MSCASRAWRAGVLALLLTWVAPAFGMGQGLKVCLEQGAPPLSSAQRQAPDAVAATLVAQWLGRPLEIVWYEGEEEEEATFAAQVNALLSAGLCQIAGGYPLVRDALRVPYADQFPLELPDGSRRFVKLGKLIHSLPYRAFGYRIVLGEAHAGRRVASLDDLSDLRILAEQNSLADNLLMAHGGGVLRRRVVHVPMMDSEGVLVALSSGHGDVALVEGPQFQALRVADPALRLTDSGYRHPLVINVGFVALDTQRRLVELFDEAVEDLLLSGEMHAAVAAIGYEHQEPVEPLVLPALTTRLLTGQTGF